jgi:5-formyltetrahydrofolate cyclo-ligase
VDKQALRERVWDDLEESGDARFPFPPHDRIPNFAGAKEAAERLAGTGEWASAGRIKANPDAPQLPVRRRALRQGKTVYVAVPRLRDADCFLRLDPDAIDDIDHATTVGGAAEVGVQVGPGAMEPIDLIVSGSVAVTEDGARVGKGEGYSDLEYGLLRERGLVDPEVPVVTTVHKRQVVDQPVETGSHDVTLDLVVTPGRAVETGATRKPTGVEWDLLSAEQIAEMPVLKRLR